MGVRNVWNDWLNAGFDPASTDPQCLRRARSVSAGGAALLLLGPPFVFLYVRAGAWTLAAVVAASLLICASSLSLLHREQRVAASGAITLASTTVVCLTVIVAAGGFYDETFASLYMLPIAAFGWLGRRNGVRFTVGLLLITALAWWVHDVPWWHTWTSSFALPDNHAMALCNRFAGILGVALLAGTLVTTHEHSEERLLHDRQQLTEAVEQSRRAENLAQHEARGRARFAATLSHELRTPMTAAMASADLLLESDLDPAQQRLAEAIVRSGQAMLGIVEDVLDYSKLQAGALPLEDREFDPREVLEDVGQMLAPQVHAKGLELVVELDHDLPRKLRGDGGRVRQIVLNLLGNALKFTEYGQLCLRASYQGSLLKLSVEDSGIGLSEEQLAHVFDPFAQAKPGAVRTGGSGLGLTIAKHFAEQMGGELYATSAPGKGCKFELVVRMPQAAPAPERQPLDLTGRVLVVDDHPRALAALRRQLADLGVDCECAGSESEARQVLADESFDRVLVDAQLPAGGAANLVEAAGHAATVLLQAPGATGIEVPEAADVVVLAKPVRLADLERVLRATPQPSSARTLAAHNPRPAGRPEAEQEETGAGESGPVPMGISPYSRAFARFRNHVPSDQDPRVTRRLLDAHLAKTATRAQRMAELIASANGEALRREARRLCANLNLIGLESECDLCSALMDLSLPGDRLQGYASIGQIERCLATVNATRAPRPLPDGREAAS